MSLDNFGGVRGVARCAARESWLARVGKLNGPVKAGEARLGVDGKSSGLYFCSKMVKVGAAARDSTKMVKVGELH